MFIHSYKIHKILANFLAKKPRRECRSKTVQRFNLNPQTQCFLTMSNVCKLQGNLCLALSNQQHDVSTDQHHFTNSVSNFQRILPNQPNSANLKSKLFRIPSRIKYPSSDHMPNSTLMLSQLMQ